MYIRSFVSEREFDCVVVCHYYLLDFVSLRKERSRCRIFGVARTGNINNVLLYFRKLYMKSVL